MKKIALEEHFVTPDFMKYTRQDFEAMDKGLSEEFISNLTDIGSKRLKAMDQAGIEISVLSLTDPGVQREKDPKIAIQLSKKVNDYLAEKISENPTRFRGFAHLALQDPKAAAEELGRCVKEHKFLGALINGQTLGKYLDEEQYHPFWTKVQELSVPIYLHPGSPYEIPQNYKDHPELNGPIWGWGVETGTHALRLVFAGLFDKFPKVKVILGHMGEMLPYFLWRFDSRWEIMNQTKHLKKMPSQYVKDNFYITTAGVCANTSLICAVGGLGEDNVMFSVDYPYESSEVAAKFIEQAPLDEKIKQKICYQNAKRILKI